MNRFKLDPFDLNAERSRQERMGSSIRPAFDPSPQQEAIFRWVRSGRGNAFIRAGAGCGKTTTGVEAVALMRGSVAFVAYNRSIGHELKERLSARGSSAVAGTFHSFGVRQWRRAFPSIKVERRKMDLIAEEMSVPEYLRGFTCRMVSLAKQSLLALDDEASWRMIVDHHELDEMLSGDRVTALEMDRRLDEALNWSRQMLMRSIAVDHQMIDFDDMIYAPLIHDVKIWQNDWVLVDEAQDTNPARRELARRMLKRTGRIIFIGDPHQAIYGFTGADNDAVDVIIREFNCTVLPLNVTYRCPKSVVRHANAWVTDLYAHESAPEGSVEEMTHEEFGELTPEDLDPTSAVLCRYNRPLMEMAHRLIKRRIPCRIEGRDIGAQLMNLAKRWKVKTLEKLADNLQKYLERETVKLMARGAEHRVDALTDRVETLLVMIEALPGGTLDDLERSVNELFGDSETDPVPALTLSSVHKAKGREWPRVYLLGRKQFMPSKLARQDWQLRQEINLIYVGVTRAKDRLVEVIVPVTRGSKGRIKR